MNKLTLFFSVFFITNYSYSQITRLIAPILEAAVPKLLPELSYKTAIALSEEQVRKLAGSFPQYKTQFQNEGKLIYSNGHFYKFSKKIFDEYFSVKRDELQERKLDSVLNATSKAKIAFEKELNFFNADRGNAEIRRIQIALQVLGYDLKRDGLLGPITKLAIQSAFGIDCSELTEKQISSLVFFQKAIVNSTKREYELTIEKQDQDPLLKRVDEKNLNIELKDYSCGTEEICATIKDKLGGSIKFNCKDAMGNNVSITISNEKANIEVNLKSPDGNTGKLSIDTNGKISMSNSDGKNSRSFSSKP